MSKFMAALADYAHTHKMTSRDLAEKLEMHESGLSRWLSGKRQPTVRNVQKVAKKLRIPAGDLL
jgi:transcriptional regulator with XRE-family HTH domain